MTTLKVWRLLIPGILIVVLFIFVIHENFNELSEFTKTLTNFGFVDKILVAVAVAVGVVYYICNIRGRLWNRYHKQIQDNIKNTLINPFRHQFSSEQEDYLKDGRTLMHVFYHFIDNDKSLSEKSKRVRFNGLIWTSTVDFTIIAGVYSLIFWIKFGIQNNLYNLVMAVVLLALSLVSFRCIKLTTEKHISLSNEQLEIICQSYKSQLKVKLDEILQNM